MGWRSGEVKQISWANYLLPGVNKTSLVTRLASSTDEEIAERISAPTSSYNTESNEETFKPDVVFKSFHRQFKTPISDRALLVGFFILWLKRCMVPTLPHEVVDADVVDSVVLFTHGESIALLPAIVVGIQNGLRTLMKSFFQVEAIVDAKGNPVKDSNGHPLSKTPCPRVELPYTYLMA